MANALALDVLDTIEFPVNFPLTYRALIATSDQNYAEDLETAFYRCGFRVTKTSVGAEAIALVREDKDKFDFVFCDEHVDGMDGYSLARSIDPILKTVFRTVYTHSASGEPQCFDLSPHILPKPVKAMQVKQLIRIVQFDKRGSDRKKVMKMIEAFPANGLEVHYKFLAAIHVLGEQACPKSIMEFMNVGVLSEKDVENQLERYKARAH